MPNTHLVRRYLPIREVVQPWAVARVKREHEWLMWIQKVDHPVVTWIFQVIGHTIGVAFYITFLPFLFWIGEMRLVSDKLLPTATRLCAFTRLNVLVPYDDISNTFFCAQNAQARVIWTVSNKLVDPHTFRHSLEHTDTNANILTNAQL